MAEAAAPDGRCIPKLLVLCLFQVVLWGTRELYDVDLGRESLSRSLSLSFMDHVEGIFCLGRRVRSWGIEVLI
jgi:hypothetical protein